MDESSSAQLLLRLRSLFREELQDDVALLADGVARLGAEQRRDERAALVQELFRVAHGLKGAAHAAGVTEAVDPCHRLEDVLADVRAGHRVVDDAVVAALAADVEALAAVQDRLALVEPPPAAVAPPPADAAPAAPPDEPRTRVAVAALEELLHEAGALVAASGRLHRLRGSPLADEAAAIERELGGGARRVARSALHLRMQPFAEVAAGLDRTARELARDRGKQARVVVAGGEAELDREVASSLREPLLHLVRNAIDHGIEPPAVRAHAGKPEEGTVRVSASVTGTRVRIAVADDGAGIDLDALRAAAGADLAAADAVELAFQPGVSTAGAVDHVSGRGIGLDAVRNRIEALGGAVRVDPGGADPAGTASGTVVVLDVPVTLAVLRVLLVEVEREVVGLPAESVEHLERVEPGRFRQADGELVLVGDVATRAVPLGAALGFSAPSLPTRPCVALRVDGGDAVLLVDRALDEQEGLVQRLPERGVSPQVFGAVVLPDDRVALVVNPSTCLRTGPAVTVAAPGSGRPPTVLLVEDSATTRVLEHGILAGAGYVVLDAGDGGEAWRLLGEHHVDVLVSDVDLPSMSGIELCRAVRASARLSRLPVVLVTGLASDEDRRRGLEAGADAYLVKSAFDQGTLLDAVRRVL